MMIKKCFATLARSGLATREKKICSLYNKVWSSFCKINININWFINQHCIASSFQQMEGWTGKNFKAGYENTDYV